ncbi:hypothetical protein [Methylobacterium sp. Leaf112]|uniref:hypothetical protein n=2 Tax=Methylobacterium TaxID=407 RepID=UPI0006FE2AC7|nr:hypothetical protein [Methylobacterium sp. Leaf112]KQP59237.1 hypothetical protein ASF52_09715 [Methylobacterium sp. Leaf112]
MSMQSQRGGGDGMSHLSQETAYGSRPDPQGLSPNIVASLACGLRAVYEARPETDVADAFADLLMRIEAAERARG